MLFLRIVSWKNASCFNGGGRVCCSDRQGGASCLSGGYAPWGASVLMGVFLKKIVGWGEGMEGGGCPHYGKPWWLHKLQNMTLHHKHYCIRRYIFCLFWILCSIKMKLGEILVQCMWIISDHFLVLQWRLRTSPRLFLIYQTAAISQQFFFILLKTLCR